MSEHVWFEENLAAYLAGGLDPAEVDRLEHHAGECGPCAANLAEARAADALLEDLFAPARPRPALEDRMIGKMRLDLARLSWRRSPWLFKIGAAVAAALILAATGAAVQTLLEEENLLFPGAAKTDPANARPEGLALYDDSDGLRRPAFSPDGRNLMTANDLAEKFRERDIHIWSDGALAGERLDAPPTDGAPAANSPLTRRWGLPKPQAEASYGYANKATLGLIAPPTSVTAAPPIQLTAPPPLPAPAGERAEEQGKPANQMLGRDGLKKADDLTYFEPGKQLQKLADLDRTETETADKQAPPREDPADRLAGLQVQDKGKKDGKVPEAQPEARRKIIRTGQVEFEVASFDPAVAAVTRLVNKIQGAFVATIDSDKLANGKVRGSIVVRVPPESLDGLVLDLRVELGKMGELLTQRIGSQDITKQYYDLESRLKAARTMETRLLKIIQEGKGEIKDLLLAEKELGVWRTRIEEFEGEMRYYATQVALSTLTIGLTEKNITTAAEVVESERVQTGIEVEDVEKAQRSVLDAVAEAKGRVTRSELKLHGAGQLNALMHFEVEPDKAGPIRDRLQQLGNVVRLEVDRLQKVEGKGTMPAEQGKVKRGPTQFLVSLYNLANIAPRETQVVKVAATDVPAAYAGLRAAVEKASGRVVHAQLNEQDQRNVSAQLYFDVKRPEDAALQSTLGELGEILSRQVSRAPQGENVTDAKVLFRVDLVGIANIPPRETVTLALETTDVQDKLAVLAAQFKEAGGKTLDTQYTQVRSGQVTARVVVEVPLAAAGALTDKLRASGKVRVQNVTRDPQAPEGKLARARLDLTLSETESLVPRDQGVASQVRSGLAFSLRGLTWSLSWLIVGLLFLLPWVLVLWVVVRLLRRLWKPTRSEPVQPSQAG